VIHHHAFLVLDILVAMVVAMGRDFIEPELLRLMRMS